MGRHRKIIVLSILLIMCLSLIGVREVKASQESELLKSAQQKIDTKAIYLNKLKYITSASKIVMNDDRPCQTGWIPKKQETTLSEVLSWLHKATVYKGKIPNPKNADKVVFHAYIGPSILNISTSNGHKIAIKPAFYIDKDNKNLYSTHYITNVLEFNYDGQKTYIQSNLLYNWMKSDKWKAEFKQ